MHRHIHTLVNNLRVHVQINKKCLQHTGHLNIQYCHCFTWAEVADQKLLWVEGEAIVFDDTYPHTVSHWGEQPRYVILVWFCHPCDGGNAHNQTCPS